MVQTTLVRRFLLAVAALVALGLSANTNPATAAGPCPNTTCIDPWDSSMCQFWSGDQCIQSDWCGEPALECCASGCVPVRM